MWNSYQEPNYKFNLDRDTLVRVGCSKRIRHFYEKNFITLIQTITVNFQKNKTPIHFLFNLLLCLRGVHLSALLSTHKRGLLYWLDLICSSTNFGVTQITCCPFQYFTIFILCSVEIISVWVMLVIWLKKIQSYGVHSGWTKLILTSNYSRVNWIYYYY